MYDDACGSFDMPSAEQARHIAEQQRMQMAYMVEAEQARAQEREADLRQTALEAAVESTDGHGDPDLILATAQRFLAFLKAE